MSSNRWLKYWSKTDKVRDGAHYHPLAYHSLDVAACGLTLLQARPGWLRNLSIASGLPEESLRPWVIFLLAIHDVGKFSDAFQKKVPELFEKLQGRSMPVVRLEGHDVLGFAFCRRKFPEWVGSKYANMVLDPETLRDHMEPWLAAVTGHHGRPPKSAAPYELLLDEQFPGIVEKDVREFWEELARLLMPNGIPLWSDEDTDQFYCTFPKASWLMAGLTVVSDWLGSNRDWFSFWEGPELSLEDYWRTRALDQGSIAVRESGLGTVTSSRFQSLRNIFPDIKVPTPLQSLTETIEILDGPQLFIVEEVTGGGKTEAAVVLTQRLMEKGLGDGLFLALPTMATATAMHDRVRKFYRGLFDGESSPTLVLAHSMARMKLALEVAGNPDGGYRDEGGNPSASQDCSRWLLDSRKRALLADVGVGTVDQALLSVLPVRHQSLRLLGLSRKILLVDEIHACDDYVFHLLCNLLKFHASWGGSAILLSATLPEEMRAQLLEAFAEGVGWSEGARPQKTDYPLLTCLSSKGLREIPFEANGRLARQVRVEWFREEKDIWKSLEGAIGRGGCACWVRNTVVDAVETYRQAIERFGKGKVRLFHARFTMGDRLEKEAVMMQDFGLQSGPEKRTGQLVIATQVVEQSLDLDFDYMVTDLAPADLILQRAGRLRRHSRDAQGKVMDGPDQRGNVVLGVWMPEASEKAGKDWYSSVFPKAAYVYPHHGQLWLTADWLQKQSGFCMPQDARAMMDAVYGQGTFDRLPEVLRDVETAEEGKDKGDTSLARFNTLVLEQGYSSADIKWDDDTNAPTRLGQPTMTVRLARQKDGGWEPWRDGDGHAWELSQLSVRRALVAEESPEDKPTTDDLRKTMPDEGRYCVVVPLREKDGRWIGRALDKNKKPVAIQYGPDLGFRLLKDDDE